jgi:hypothetical protein
MVEISVSDGDLAATGSEVEADVQVNDCFGLWGLDGWLGRLGLRGESGLGGEW